MAPTSLHSISVFVLSLVLVCIVDIASTHGQQNHGQLLRRDLAVAPKLSARSLSSSGSAGTEQSTSEPFDDPLGDSELLDVVLVASVDGKFHALNRTSGQVLWSMPSFAPGQSEDRMFDYGNMTSLYPSTLAPLVRTVHPEHDYGEEIHLDDDTVHPDDEIYIIEPQSGAIYILPSNPSSSQSPPLRRFPFTMPELVDLSPFSFADPDGHSRFFVGRKETSLLVVELETGKIKASVGGECPWDPYEDLKQESGDYELDLDELETEEHETKEKVKPTEVYIGRTDYHISIHTRPSRTSNSPRPRPPPVQNLSFSTYGPNNQDTVLQGSYTRTKDNAYVQSLPTGELVAFRARNTNVGSPKVDANDMPFLWLQQFSNPIVATFDVFRRSSGLPEAHAFVLLQPQPSLTDFHPSLSQAPKSLLPNSDSAYVGMVEETGSLFAMSPKKFPFVAFGGSGYTGSSGGRQLIDAPVVNYGPREPQSTDDGDDDEQELPVDVDEITRQRKLRQEREQREKAEQAKHRHQNTCHSESNVFDLRCLVGVRKLEGGVDGEPGEGLEEGRWSRLLDAPPSSNSGNPPNREPENASESESESEAGLGRLKDGGKESSGSRDMLGQPGDSWSKFHWKWEIVFALLIGLVGVSGVAGKYKSPPKANISEAAVSLNVDTPRTPNADHSSTSILSTAITSASDVDVKSPTSGINHSLSSPTPTKRQRKDSITPLSVSDAVDAPSTSNAVNNGDATPTPASASLDEGDDSEGEGDDAEGGDVDPADTGARKKRTRRKRGKKKKGGAAAANTPIPGSEAEDAGTPSNIQGARPSTPKPAIPAHPLPLPDMPPSMLVVPPTPSLLTPTPARMQEQALPSNLVVSDTILGFGSHGTVVFRGSLQGRSVAVKRLLRDFVTLASREVSILQESDDHPNVIRYYYQESHANFLYIALELCPGSLADVIEMSGDLGGLDVDAPDDSEEAKSQKEWREIRQAILGDPKKALKQITSGLRHLHGLKLVHRDIKPQNILVAAGPGRTPSASANKGKPPRGSTYRMLISDFGLCKKLEMDQTSFLPTAQGGMGAGTFGWRAPEILKGEVKLDDAVNGTMDDASTSSGGTVMGNSSVGSNGSSGSAGRARPTRLTKSVDIFALGCLYYYVLTGGGHPFGDRYEREVNILKGSKNLCGLDERLGEEGVEATDLVEAMLHQDAGQRPDTTGCLLHPFFWDSGRRLNFLQEASDRFETMCRDPRDPHLVELEKNAFDIVGNDWHSRVDRIFIENLGKFRKYDGKSVQDLLRALRNKKHHYQDLPNNVKSHLGSMPDGYLSYFARRYPLLFLHVYRVVSDCELRSESMFRTYYELTE